MNRLLYLLPIIVIALLGGIFAIGLGKNSGNDIPSTLIGRDLPLLPEAGLVGYEAGNIEEIISNNPVTLVNYFASWCGPCRAEHEQLIAFSEAGIPVIGINYKDQEKNAIIFLEELGNPYEALRVDESGRTAIEWGVAGVPETFFIDRNGKVLRRHTGPITEDIRQNDLMPMILEQQ